MIKTRLVTAQDYDDWSALWRKYLDFYESEKPLAVYQASWSRALDPDTPMHSALAFVRGQAVGLVNFLYHPSFWDIEDRCYLNDLYVEPQLRSGGIGEALINLVRDHAQARGAAQVYWLTAQDNERASRLYDRLARRTAFVKYQC